MNRAFWTCAVITTVSAGVSAGFSVQGLLGPSGNDSFAQYAASRSIALLIAAIACLVARSVKATIALAFVMTLVQAFDGVVGMQTHNPFETYGPFFFAVANLAALIWLFRSVKEQRADH